MNEDRQQSEFERNPNARDVGHEAYIRLRDAIRDRKLAPGARITETELSAMLGISRTPVREAIYRLEGDGLVAHEPRRGLFIAQPDHNMILEIYAAREILEGAAAGFTAQHASDTEIGILQDVLKQEQAALGDARRLDQLNRSLHGLIYVAGRNRYVSKMLENLAATASLLPTMLSEPERARQAHGEHCDIIAAIAARDTDAAEKAARAHMRSAMAHRLRLVAMQLGAS